MVVQKLRLVSHDVLVDIAQQIFGNFFHLNLSKIVSVR
jgi:hypothetical protein